MACHAEEQCGPIGQASAALACHTWKEMMNCALFRDAGQLKYGGTAHQSEVCCPTKKKKLLQNVYSPFRSLPFLFPTSTHGIHAIYSLCAYAFTHSAPSCTTPTH